jgi:pimeloyl-ACP methyl ester carboxylesterase
MKILNTLPGTLQTSHFFTLSADDYAKNNIVVAAITLPGSGSDPSNYPFNAETYVENDLKKIISAVVPPTKKFLVVGVSMGGAVAAHLSSAYDLDRNDKTLLVIPVSPLNPADTFEGQHLEDTSNFRFITKNTILKKIFSWFIYFNVIRNNGVLFSKNEQFTATRPQHKAHFRPKLSDDFLRSVKYGSVGIRHAFDVISAPWTVDWKKLGEKKVIIASGTLDDTTQPSMQKYLHEKIRNSEVIEFDGAHLDFVEIFDDLIYKALNRE